MQPKTDIELTCNNPNCRRTFTFTVEEQEFIEKKGWNTQPKKCNDCRRERNALRNSQPAQNERY